MCKIIVGKHKRGCIAGYFTASFSHGDADIRSGHALADIKLRSIKGRDSLLLSLDSRPDENRFDVDLTVDAPKGGLLASMVGLKQDANLRLEGQGDWAAWDGRLIATLAGKSAAGLNIHLRKGNFLLEGAISGGAIATRGLLARLSSPELIVRAQGRYADKLLSKLDEQAGQAIREKSLDAKNYGVQRQQELRSAADGDGFVEENLWTGIGRARSGCGAAIVGTPDQVIAKLRAYQDAGMEAFILSGYPHVNECDMFARYVLPQLQHGPLVL